MQLFRFEHSEFLYALILVPVLLLVFILTRHQKKKKLAEFGELHLVNQLMPDISRFRPMMKFIVLMFAMASLIIAIANPQIGSKLEKAKRQGVDLVIALDVSNSMLAEDIEPNRLTRAKRVISKLIDRLDADRIGLVVFAGRAYTQIPITTDYSAAKMILSTLDNKIVGEQGTAIGAAIEQAIGAFDSENTKTNKAVIVITDGENHEDDAIEQAKAAKEQGVFVHTLGMGKPSGVPIPVYRNAYSKDYKKDREGNTVITKLNESMLKDVADAGGGKYVRANNTNVGLNELFDEINKMEKTEFESKVFTDYEDRFQYFLAIAVFLLIIEILIFERKPKWLSKTNLFKV